MAQANEPEAMAPLSFLMSLSDEERDEQWTLRWVTTNHALASPWSDVAGSPTDASVKGHFCSTLYKGFPGRYVENSSSYLQGTAYIVIYCFGLLWSKWTLFFIFFFSSLPHALVYDKILS